MDSTVISRASSLLKNVWFAAWGHVAYKISSEIGMPCRPGALTGRLFQRAVRVCLVSRPLLDGWPVSENWSSTVLTTINWHMVVAVSSGGANGFRS